MGNRHTAYYCNGLVENFISEIEKYKKSIIDNFYDMDLENADVLTEYEEIVEAMVLKCDEMISEVSRYNFR